MGAARRLLPYRVLDRDKFTADSLKGLHAVLWIEETAPAGAVAEQLDKFVREIGLLPPV